jgi:PAS domain S-box-containing protein
VHPVLRRQLKRVKLTEDAPPTQEAWRRLVEIVDRTYTQADQDRYTLERSLDLSSTELRALYEGYRQSAARALASVNASLDSIVDNIPDVILVRDASTLRFVRINHAGEELLGLRAVDVVGKLRSELPDGAQALVADSPALAALRDGLVVSMPDRRIEIGGRALWLQTKLVPVAPEGSALQLLLEISADVSERYRISQELERRVAERTAALRAAEEQLRQSQKLDAIGRLAGGVAHDFNNMLAVVLSCTELALGQLGSEAEVIEDLREVHAAAKRASALTQQLLAFSRQQVLEPRTVDLNAIVEEMGGMVARLIGETIRVRVDLRRSVGCILADPSQVQQVILNLVVNARDAMATGGTLEVETETATSDQAAAAGLSCAGGFVVLVVRDTGTGINEETLGRVFEPFFTTKERGKGTGLGLSTVYGIARQSGGTVAIETAVGRGTTVRVFFPVAPCSESARRTVVPSAPSGGGERILLVEDDDQVRRAASRILRKAGYEVLVARHAEEALELAMSDTVHVVLTDVILPGLSGDALAKRLLAQGLTPSIVFMSGYLDRPDARTAVQNPHNLFVPKPFSPTTLLRAVREALDRSSPSERA